MPDTSNPNDPTVPQPGSSINVERISASTIKSGRQDVNSLNVTRLNLMDGSEKDSTDNLSAALTNEIQNLGNTLKSELGYVATTISNMSKNVADGNTAANRQAYNASLNSNNSTSSNSGSDVVNALYDIRSAIISQTMIGVNGGSNSGGSNSGGSGTTIGDSIAKMRLLERAQNSTAATIGNFTKKIGDETRNFTLGEYTSQVRTRERALKAQLEDETNTEIRTTHDVSIALRNFKRQFTASDPVTKYLSVFTKGIGGLVSSGLLENLKSNLTDLSRTFQRATTDFVSFGRITQGAQQEFVQSVAMSASGVTTTMSGLLDIAPVLVHGRDSLKSAFDTIQYSIQNDLLNPIGIVGTSLSNVAKNMRNVRLDLKSGGSSALTRLSAQASNDSILSLYDINKRMYIDSKITDSQSKTLIRKQLDMSMMIATNTGRTVDEVIRLSHATSKAIANTVSAGVLNRQQGDNYKAAASAFTSNNMSEMAGLVSQIASASGNIAIYASQNKDTYQSMAVTGHLGQLQDMISMMNNRDSSTPYNEYISSLMTISKQFGKNGYMGSVGGQVLNTQFQNISGEVSRAKPFTPSAKNDFIQSTLSSLSELVTNVLGTNFKLITAIGANILALGFNTAALGLASGTNIFGLFRGGFSKITGFVGVIAGSVGKIVASISRLIGLTRTVAPVARAVVPALSSMGAAAPVVRSVLAPVGRAVAASVVAPVASAVTKSSNIIAPVGRAVAASVVAPVASAVTKSSNIIAPVGRAVAAPVIAPVASAVTKSSNIIAPVGRAVAAPLFSSAIPAAPAARVMVTPISRSITAPVVEAAAAAGAARAAAPAAAAAAGTGKLVLKAIPLLGTAIGAVDTVVRLVHRDYVGAGMAAAGTAATMIPIPGVRTAATLGIFGSLAARDIYNSSQGTTTAAPNVSTTVPIDQSSQFYGATTPTPIRTETQRLIMETNSALYTILSVMEQGLMIQRNIANNTAYSSSSASDGLFSYLVDSIKGKPPASVDVASFGNNGNPTKQTTTTPTSPK